LTGVETQKQKIYINHFHNFLDYEDVAVEFIESLIKKYKNKKDFFKNLYHEAWDDFSKLFDEKYEFPQQKPPEIWFRYFGLNTIASRFLKTDKERIIWQKTLFKHYPYPEQVFWAKLQEIAPEVIEQLKDKPLKLYRNYLDFINTNKEKEARDLEYDKIEKELRVTILDSNPIYNKPFPLGEEPLNIEKLDAFHNQRDAIYQEYLKQLRVASNNITDAYFASIKDETTKLLTDYLESIYNWAKVNNLNWNLEEDEYGRCKHNWWIDKAQVEVEKISGEAKEQTNTKKEIWVPTPIKWTFDKPVDTFSFAVWWVPVLEPNARGMAEDAIRLEFEKYLKEYFENIEKEENSRGKRILSAKQLFKNEEHMEWLVLYLCKKNMSYENIAKRYKNKVGKTAILKGVHRMAKLVRLATDKTK